MADQLNFSEVDMAEGGKENPTDVEVSGTVDTLRGISSSLSEVLVPKVGMEFVSEEDAYKFYVAYASELGFKVRKSRFHNDKSGNRTDRMFCCSAAGKRGKDKRDKNVKRVRTTTRCGCEAKLRIIQRGGTFRVIEFIEGHNHFLSFLKKNLSCGSHRKIDSATTMQIEMESGVGSRPETSYDLMIEEVGGQDGFYIPNNYRSYLPSKRTRTPKVGDTAAVLDYLHRMQIEDPNFFFAIQVDEDDLMTNIFWADAKMRADYSKFGDVVCFDTTYRKIHEGRPIAIFVGVNHHKQTIIFGVALLYDDTSPTFEWLFNIFARAMWDRRPTTILTGQYAAITDALSRWPETNHRLCIWQIYQDGAIHLSRTFYQFRDFSKDFSSCLYDFEEEEDFLSAWKWMLESYDLKDDDWLRYMFGIKEKWALVYGREMFCADITSTQRNGSMSSIVKRHVTYQHKFLNFLNQFDTLLEDLRYEELKADLKMKSIPSLPYPIEMLKHAAHVYTEEVFELFKKEWCESHDSSIITLEEIGSATKYKITPHGKSFHHTVVYDLSSGQIKCSCRKFEFVGILCSHVLKAFSLKPVMVIPSQYILKRWTRKAKHGYLGGGAAAASTKNLDPKVCQHKRYKELCGLYSQLVMKAAESEDAYKNAKYGVLKMLADIDSKSLDDQQ